MIVKCAVGPGDIKLKSMRHLADSRQEDSPGHLFADHSVLIRTELTMSNYIAELMEYLFQFIIFRQYHS